MGHLPRAGFRRKAETCMAYGRSPTSIKMRIFLTFAGLPPRSGVHWRLCVVGDSFQSLLKEERCVGPHGSDIQAFDSLPQISLERHRGATEASKKPNIKGDNVQRMNAEQGGVVSVEALVRYRERLNLFPDNCPDAHSLVIVSELLRYVRSALWINRVERRKEGAKATRQLDHHSNHNLRSTRNLFRQVSKRNSHASPVTELLHRAHGISEAEVVVQRVRDTFPRW